MKLTCDTLNVILIILIVSMIIIIINIRNNSNKHNQEHMINLPYEKTSWNRNICQYKMNKTLEDELKNNNINKSNEDWNLYLPCSYNDINKEINQMPIVKNAKYFIIDNADIMIAKDKLWTNLVSHYGLDKAKTLIPNSYVLYNKSDIDRFKNEYTSDKIYIMKKNIQRQEGLKITKSKDEILNGYKNGYVVVQELLQDPYLIDGRKTNMRFYVLVVCHKGEINVWVHKNGFMYYTKTPFVKNSVEIDPNITTGYIDRKVYEVNPLTHEDLRQYLDKENRTLSQIEKNIRNQNLKISDIYFNRIYHLLKDVFITFVGRICNSKLSDSVSYQLFGIDIAVNDKLNPMIIEINKGPDMGAKDVRDSKVKHKVMGDILTIIGAKPKSDTDFIRVLDINNGVFNMSDL